MYILAFKNHFHNVHNISVEEHPSSDPASEPAPSTSETAENVRYPERLTRSKTGTLPGPPMTMTEELNSKKFFLLIYFYTEQVTGILL